MNHINLEVRFGGVWEHFTMREGLPDLKIECIYEDSRGIIWIGTHDKGVVAFSDGGFNEFTIRDGLAGNGVYSIVEDDLGRLWFGTDRGLCHYYERKFEIYKVKEPISCLWGSLKDAQGWIWFGLKGGPRSKSFICKIRDEIIRFIDLDCDESLSGGINDLLEDKNGVIWCCGPSLYRIDGNCAELIQKTEKMSISAISADAQGGIWLSTRSGLYRYNGETDDLDIVDSNMSDGCSIVSMSKDHHGFLWFISEDGKLYRSENGVLNEIVKSDYRFWRGAHFDSVGRLWVSSYGMGLYCYDFQRLLLYDNDDFNTNKRVNCLAVGDDGVIWVGVDGGFIRHKDDKFEAVPGNVEVTALCVVDGKLWIGDRTGKIYRYYDGEIHNTESVLEPYGLRVKCLVEDNIGRIWFGSYHGRGFGYYDDLAITYFEPKENAEYPSWISDIGIDGKGRIWLGSASPANWDGLCCYDNGVYNKVSNISEYSILSLLIASDGRLWIGTNEGVLCYDSGIVKKISQKDGLSYDIITSISEGRDGVLWFGTEGGGVCCFDGQILQSIQIPGNADFNVIHDVIEGDEGVIWFATQGGLVRYHRRNIKPDVAIIKVVADKEYISPLEVQCTVGVGSINFCFHGWSSCEFTKYLVYRYKLDGVDNEWKQTKDTSVNYTQVRPGEYRFIVQAIDRDLNYSDPATVELIITEDLLVEGLSEALRVASVGGGEFIGESPTIRQVKRQVQEVAWSDLTVLVLGETGTGKGLAVRAIHEMSERKERAFIHVNCGSVQKELFDSELFGHEKGAFTGAIARKLGKFELAERGTIFLDEIGDLPLESQTRLLHVLQEKKIERVGGTQPIDVNVRVIAATNRNLIEAVREGHFRADLYYRLNVFPVEIPPLRERIEDVGLLAKYFVRRFASHLHQQQPFIHEDSLKLMRGYNWPGNVRELEHILQRAVILAGAGTIMPAHLAIERLEGEGSFQIATSFEEIMPLDEFERRYIVKVLERTKGVIQGKNGAADLLGIKPTTLRSRLDRLGVDYKKTQL